MENLNILLVDDDADIGMFMKLKLSKDAPHFSIAFVESGLECLDYLKTHTVDCILSDYQMPGMDGMELLRAIKGQGIDVPVIFVTGQGSEEVAREAFKNGAYDYFTKEVGFAHFARIINSVEQAVKQRDAENAVKERDFWINESQRVARLGSYVLNVSANRWTSSAILDEIFGISNDYDKSLHGWLSLVHPYERDRMTQYFAEVLTQKKRFESEYRIIRLNDGQERWVYGLGELVDGKDGNTAKMFGTIQDVTERKQMENALRSSQEFLKSIIDNEPECVKILNSDGSLLMMNRAGLDMIQADSLDQVKGKNMLDLVAPEYRKAFKALNMKVFYGGTGKLEFDVIGLKESLLRLETNAVPLYDEKGKVTALLGITRDITEQKRAERALEEKQRAYQSLAENLPGIVYRVFLRENNRMQFFNRAAEGVTGYTDRELTAGEVCCIDNLILPEDRRRVIESVKQAVLERKPFSVEYRLRHKTGSICYVLERGEPVYGSDDMPLYIDGMIFDITKRKELERRQVDLLAMISHDIKTPLTAILGNMEQLSEMAGKFDAETNEMITAVKTSGERIHKLVDGFLTVSEMESGKLSPKLFPSDISETLQELFGGFEKAIKKKGITLNVEIAEGLPAKVLMDRQLVHRAVANMLQNAFNYTPAGGKITLKAEPVSEKGDDFIMISVADTGQGISAEEHESVFEKYYRSPNASWVKGSGLGLAIVKAVACAHGGRVELQSEREKGSTFKVYLPMAH
jgi:PAS domain S-box-containing protein